MIVALALLAIGYLVFSANSGPATTVDVNSTPAVTSTDPALAPAPMTETPAPAAPEAAPMTEAPAVETAPAVPAETPAGAGTETAPVAPGV
ncbi:hypothetical protein VE26_09960 [Devosia chinhatensis]|uniref:Dynamin n=1 Tax=Devosia chinhatensis TaxID=429727 RepID=A0A0F5FPA6_9HYPH|nr:hypothetical protein VE26_09960 [Devosia chinhatensis]